MISFLLTGFLNFVVLALIATLALDSITLKLSVRPAASPAGSLPVGESGEHWSSACLKRNEDEEEKKKHKWIREKKVIFLFFFLRPKTDDRTTIVSVILFNSPHCFADDM